MARKLDFENIPKNIAQTYFENNENPIGIVIFMENHGKTIKIQKNNFKIKYIFWYGFCL